jgi:hypothetical protein
MTTLLTRRNLLLGSASVILFKTRALADSLTPDEARAIAREATIYGVPMLDAAEWAPSTASFATGSSQQPSATMSAMPRKPTSHRIAAK